ncbi:TPA: hypothetical protein MI354_26755 [Klebsiella pneumoniae]|nr:hypothetical protein [Klebsiella pneumoniae]
MELPLTLSNNNPPTIKHLPETKYNYTRAADRVNSENVLVVWDVPVVAQHGEPAEFGKNRTLRFSGHP